MPFTCAICSLDIAVGEELLTDEKMNLAHKRCVDRLAQDPSHPSISIPTVFLSPPPPPPPTPPPSPLTEGKVVFTQLTGTCDRCKGPASALTPRSCRRCYLDLCPKCEAAGCCGSKPASIGEKTFCSICSKPCRSMCPVCKSYVHGSYGMFNQNCGGAHEEKCPGARALREPNPEPTQEQKVQSFKEAFFEMKLPPKKVRLERKRRIKPKGKKKR